MTGVIAIAVFFVTEGEEIVLGGGEAMETELEVGTGTGELGLGLADGRERSNVGCRYKLSPNQCLTWLSFCLSLTCW
jgi:hypothetical protein